MHARIPLTLTVFTMIAGMVTAVTLSFMGQNGQSSAESCVGLVGSEETTCFTEVFVDEYETDGLESAVALMEYTSTDPGMLGERFAARCHEIAHAIGLATRITFEPNLDSRAPTRCRSGFFHGIHSQRFAVHSGSAALLTVAPSVCVGSEVLIGVGRGGVGNGCRHALGHEMLLRGADPLDAARACMLPVVATHNPESAAADCLHGLYMEVFLTFEATGSYQDPVVVCAPARSVALAASLACIGESGPSLFRLGESDGTKSAFHSCTVFGEQDQALALSCAGGLGRAASAFLANDREDLELYCIQGGALFDPCLIDAAAAAMEAEQDYSWASVCALVKLIDVCEAKMRDIKSLVELRP